MELNDTVPMMLSDDYKERFRAEFHQVRIRQEKLYRLLCDWDDGVLDFTPDCPYMVLARQYKAMGNYLAILVERAHFEDIDLYAPAEEVAR